MSGPEGASGQTRHDDRWLSMPQHVALRQNECYLPVLVLLWFKDQRLMRPPVSLAANVAGAFIFQL